MSAARDPDQADFDLERFVDMFDTAMTSSDPRVVETLRKLMMIVALTQPETPVAERTGPLRRLFEDMNHLNRRIHRMEDEVRQINNRSARQEREAYHWEEKEKEKYTFGAAQQVAAKIDQDVINQLKMAAIGKVNGGQIKGLK